MPPWGGQPYLKASSIMPLPKLPAVRRRMPGARTTAPRSGTACGRSSTGPLRTSRRNSATASVRGA